MLLRTIKLRDRKVFLHWHDDFKETEHPRAKSGEFTKKGTGGGGGAISGPTTTSTGVKPKSAPGAVVVNPIALILKKHGYEKQKGSNIYKHPSGHEVEVHAASDGQKWLTGWTHSSGSTGSGAGRLDAHLELVSKTKPKTQTPPTKQETKPEAEKPPPKPTTTTTTAKGAKPPSDTAEGEKHRIKHQERVRDIITEGYSGGATPSPAKTKKMLSDITDALYDYMGVDKAHVPFSIGRMALSKIGSRKFRPGGFFTPSTNAIVIGTNNHPKTYGGLAAHELMHAKFQAMKNADKLSKFMDNTDDLEKDDGITSYSREWWKAFKDGKATQELAVNETLAEMANLDWKGELTNLKWFKESKTYKPLYEEIHKSYPDVVAGKPAKTTSTYPTNTSVLKKAGFDRAYTAHGLMVVGYGTGFTAVINPNSGTWKSNHGNGTDYDSLLKALEKYKNDTKHLEKYK